MAYAILISNVVNRIEQGEPSGPPEPPLGYVLLGSDETKWPSTGDIWVTQDVFRKPEPAAPQVPEFDLVLTDVLVTGVDPKLVVRRGPLDIRAPKGCSFTPVGSVQLGGQVLVNFTGDFALPVEKRGGSPVPLFVYIEKGVIVNTVWTPGAPGFYNVTEVGINSELESFRLKFPGLRLIVSEV